MSGPGKFPRVESNVAAGSTPGSALPSISLSFSLGLTILPQPGPSWAYQLPSVIKRGNGKILVENHPLLVENQPFLVTGGFFFICQTLMIDRDWPLIHWV